MMMTSRGEFAALPLSSAERLCLSGQAQQEPGGYASARGAASGNTMRMLGRYGRALPHCAAAKPRAFRRIR